MGFERSVRRNRQAAASGRVRGHRSKRRQQKWAEPPRQHLSQPTTVGHSQPQAEMVDFDARLSEIIAAMPPMETTPALAVYRPRPILAPSDFLEDYFARKGGKGEFKGRTRRDGSFFSVEMPVDTVTGVAKNVSK